MSIRENSNRTEYNHRVGYRVLISYKEANKYKTPLKGPYKIFQIWTIRTVNLRMGAVTYRIKIRRNKPYNTKDAE